MNPFKMFCVFGIHTWIEVKGSKYWKEEGKFVTTYHKKTCCNCDKEVVYK